MFTSYDVPPQSSKRNSATLFFGMRVAAVFVEIAPEKCFGCFSECDTAWSANDDRRAAGGEGRPRLDHDVATSAF